MKSSFIWAAWLGIGRVVLGAAAAPRGIPTPLPDHPGNVFLTGENVTVPVPDGDWLVFDYEEKQVAAARAENGRLRVGPRPPGFYRLRQAGRAEWVSFAVIEPLKAPTPLSSPIALDVAMAWFYPKEKMDAVANLCALAGVNWVRDRLAWGHMEPKREQWSGPNRYDDSARAQARAGLQVLQVNHTSPSWANPVTKRFPLDLRDAYRFHREMARRWRGQVLAFEPWNEADIEHFGGHTGSEMAAMQKAAYLGLKAGNPDVIACLNVFAVNNRAQLDDLHENQAWPYFDTFNLHHYAPWEEYPKIYADFRAVCAGRPLWVSEFARPVKWAGDERLKEPTDADSRVLAERVAKVFACSLHEGSVASFYFLLPHYVEGQTQFGILRPDLTPRPGYVALAAVGRLLADAKPLGKLWSTNSAVQAYLFAAKPDGPSRDVLVAWAASGQPALDLPARPDALFDHLGRRREASSRLALGGAPLFAVLPEHSAARFALQAPPAQPARLPGEASPVVFQALWPQTQTVLKKSAYRMSSEKPVSVPLFAYNFSDARVTGRLEVAAPAGWRVALADRLELAPQSRAELRLELDCRDAAPRLLETVRINGDFGPAGRPVLSMRVMPEPLKLSPKTSTAVPEADAAARWQPMISGNGLLRITASDGAVLIEAEPRGSDRWVYPRLPLPAGHRAPQGATALACTITLLEGDGQFRVIFDEENGSGYVADFLTPPKRGEAVEAVALVEGATFGAGWSKPDPNGRLDPAQIAAIKIGCNTRADRVKFAVRNVRWVAP